MPATGRTWRDMSQLNIVKGVLKKPVAGERLIEALSDVPNLQGELYLGFPLLGSSSLSMAIDALLVSSDHGLVVFDLIEGTSLEGHEERQDMAANLLEAKLRACPGLTQRRNLLTQITAISFGPALPQHILNNLPAHYPACTSSSTLATALDRALMRIDERVHRLTLSALQNVLKIRSSRGARVTLNETSKGSRLKALEEAISTLDHTQSTAVIETVKGVQRIRGLAGSGKTIVLALKAAYLHAQYPEWRIAVTFNTRSLKGQFKRLINTFSINQTGEEPNWERLRVINAWGASGGEEREGIYYQFCRDNRLPCYDFSEASSKFGGVEKAFEGAVAEALESLAPKPSVCLYDAILVDEAQDFPSNFLLMCYEALNEDRNLVYAYDELQSLAGQSMPPPEEIFGTKASGEPRVDFGLAAGTDRRDIILQVCYRNSRPLLTAAHALGFGIYRSAPPARSTGLVQMFDSPKLWQDIGYEVRSGELVPGSAVTLERSARSSPTFLEEHSSVDDLIQFQVFATVG